MTGGFEIDAAGRNDESNPARVRLQVDFHGDTNEIVSINKMRSMSIAEAAPYLTEAMGELFYAVGPYVLQERLFGMVETMKKTTPTETWELSKPVRAYKENPFKIKMNPGPTKEYDYPNVVFHGYTLSPIQFADMVQKIFRGGGHEAWANAVPLAVRQGVDRLSEDVVAAINQKIEQGLIQLPQAPQELPKKRTIFEWIFRRSPKK